jgi:transposase InsO family protein
MSRISLMCRIYGVTRGGYYAWRKRPKALRTRENERLIEKIQAIHQDSDRSYGSPRIHAALTQAGECISENRTARLMRAHQVQARVTKLYRHNPAHHAFFAGVPNESLGQLADQPNRVWVGDVTYLKAGGVWLYLAVVMDKYSRRIVGWAVSKERTAMLVLKALNRAVQARRPSPGLIFHSDRGIEYASYIHRDRLTQLGFVQSMNRPNRMNDNAHMESFFHSFKSDQYHGRRFAHIREIMDVVKRYIPFYNTQRLHSAIGYVSPVSYESQAN